jgi:hypothetical protein
MEHAIDAHLEGARDEFGARLSPGIFARLAIQHAVFDVRFHGSARLNAKDWVSLLNCKGVTMADERKIRARQQAST